MRRSVRRATTLLVTGTLSALVVAGPAVAASSYTASLSAEEEVPNAGPAGAKGKAAVMIDGSTGKVCSTLAWEGVGEATAAHIHEGGRGVAGPVVIDLGMPTNGKETCVMAPAEKAAAVVKNHAGYYVNIHTAEYKAGAMRGQLEGGMR